MKSTPGRECESATDCGGLDAPRLKPSRNGKVTLPLHRGSPYATPTMQRLQHCDLRGGSSPSPCSVATPTMQRLQHCDADPGGGAGHGIGDATPTMQRLQHCDSTSRRRSIDRSTCGSNCDTNHAAASALRRGDGQAEAAVGEDATPTMQRLQHCDRDRKSSSDLRPLRAGFRALSFAAASDWCDGITPPPSGKPTPAVFLGRRRPTAPLPPARTGRPASAAGAAELLCAARSASARIFFAALISRSRTRPQLVQWCVRCARVFGTSAPQPEQRCEVWRGSTSTSRALSRSAL